MDSTGLNAIVLILGLAYFVLIVVMIVKFFGMASDLQAIRETLERMAFSGAKTSGNALPLRKLELSEQVKVDGVKCLYHGKKDGKHSFYPFEEENLSGKNIWLRTLKATIISA